jgi:hypothetical protein
MLGGLVILAIGLDALFMLVFRVLILKLVRSRRLELPQGCPHSDLNAARLPFRHDRTPLNVSDIFHHGKAFSLRLLWDRLKTSSVLTGF